MVISLVGLYLYDSIRLLAGNEALLCRTRGGKWSILFGSDRFQIRGKEPLLPNPFLPHRPLYRLVWQTEGLPGPVRQWTPPPGNLYFPLAPFIFGMALGLFGLIPLGLFSKFGNVTIAAGIVVFYLNALSVLTCVWIKREAYQCSGRRFASLAFESLTCPPFALNIVRHLSMAIPVSEDMLSAGRRILGENEWAEAVDQFVIRVDNEIAWEPEGSNRARALTTHRQYLQQESNSCRLLES